MKSKMWNAARVALLVSAAAAVVFAACKVESDSGPTETRYTVQVGLLSNGTITSSPAKSAAGKTVTLTVAPSAGYKLKAGSVKVNGGLVTYIPDDEDKTLFRFLMPAENVQVTAAFELANVIDDFENGGNWGGQVGDPYWYGGPGDAQITAGKDDTNINWFKEGKNGIALFYGAFDATNTWVAFGKFELDFDLSPFETISFWALVSALGDDFVFSIADGEGVSFDYAFSPSAATTWESFSIQKSDLEDAGLDVSNIMEYTFAVGTNTGNVGQLRIDSIKAEF
jgi:hypothetical protein